MRATRTVFLRIAQPPGAGASAACRSLAAVACPSRNASPTNASTCSMGSTFCSPSALTTVYSRSISLAAPRSRRSSGMKSRAARKSTVFGTPGSATPRSMVVGRLSLARLKTTLWRYSSIASASSWSVANSADRSGSFPRVRSVFASSTAGRAAPEALPCPAARSTVAASAASTWGAPAASRARLPRRGGAGPQRAGGPPRRKPRPHERRIFEREQPGVLEVAGRHQVPIEGALEHRRLPVVELLLVLVQPQSTEDDGADDARRPAQDAAKRGRSGDPRAQGRRYRAHGRDRIAEDAGQPDFLQLRKGGAGLRRDVADFIEGRPAGKKRLDDAEHLFGLVDPLGAALPHRGAAARPPDNPYELLRGAQLFADLTQARLRFVDLAVGPGSSSGLDRPDRRLVCCGIRLRLNRLLARARRGVDRLLRGLVRRSVRAAAAAEIEAEHGAEDAGDLRRAFKPESVLEHQDDQATCDQHEGDDSAHRAFRPPEGRRLQQPQRLDLHVARRGGVVLARLAASRLSGAGTIDDLFHGALELPLQKDQADDDKKEEGEEAAGQPHDRRVIQELRS